MSEKSFNIGRLEALLFYHGEPVSIKKVASVLGVSEEDARNGILVLQEKYKTDDKGGLALILRGNEVQLVTKPEHGTIFDNLIKDDLKEELTPAALETVSLVAYLGPLTRPEIDYIRGVNSSFILRNLLLRGLVLREEEKGKGGLFRYSASFEFLKHLGIENTSQLPEYEKYRGVLESVRRANEDVRPTS